jgi:aldehyde dehydrogenase (NAD+)
MRNIGNFFIGGAWVAPVGMDRHPLVDPATEAVIATLPMASAEDVDRAVTAARTAFDSWADTPKAERLRLLQRLLELYNGAYDELAALMTQEMGTTAQFSRDAQAWVGRAHLEAAIAALEAEPFEEMRGGTMISKEPIGVCALITPWNWPMNQLVVKVAPALAAGCTVVAKPSEFSPLSSIRFAELVEEAGFPPGVYNHLTGSGPVAGEALARHPEVDMVSITGSTRAGIAVAKAAADTVKRVTQELGGKSANILLRDADLEVAVRQGVLDCFGNAGQACKAPSRMLVPRELMDRAATIAAATADALTVGPPDGVVDLGPVVNESQWNRIQSLIGAGVDEGARLVAGGPGRPEHLARGWYVRPTVFADVAHGSTIATEEIFGPVIALIPYDSEEEAVRIANDSIYGLAAYIQTGDPAKARALARKLRVGMVYVNGAGWDASAPFGGYKQSGNGREHGAWGLADYLEVKATAGL